MISVRINSKRKIFQEIFNEVYESSRLSELEKYIQHGDTTVLKHSIAVAYYSHRMAQKLRIKTNEKRLIRGALLHDYFLYDWHDKNNQHPLHGFTHPYTARQNAALEFQLGKVEKDIIVKHMFPLTPLPPRYRESIIVCLVDKGCSLYETFRRGVFSELYNNTLRGLSVCSAEHLG